MSIMHAVMGCIAASDTDYGISLPSSIVVSASGKTDVVGSLVFNTGGRNEIGWNSPTQFYVWNEYDRPREFYEVRLVHLSGSAPTSGASINTWLPATLIGSDLTWRWTQTTVGTISGSFSLEIRNKFTQKIVASCPVGVSVTVEEPEPSVFTLIGGQAAHSATTGYGLGGAFPGSISPDHYKGRFIPYLRTWWDSGIARADLQFALEGGGPDRNQFTTLEIKGTPYHQADAIFTDFGSAQRWVWPDVSQRFGYNRESEIIIY